MADEEVPQDGFRPLPSLARTEPDAHGQAALLLAESTLHTLVESGVLTVQQALGAVQTAVEVKVDVAAETGESEGRMLQSLGLLRSIKRGFDENR